MGVVFVLLRQGGTFLSLLAKGCVSLRIPRAGVGGTDGDKIWVLAAEETLLFMASSPEKPLFLFFPFQQAHGLADDAAHRENR